MIIRILLFSGLIIHKLVWEICKRKYPPVMNGQSTPGRPVSASNPATNVMPRIAPPPLSLKKVIKFCKIALLLFFIAQSLFLDILPIAGSPAFLRYIGLALFFGGLCISVAARIRLGENWTDLEELHILPRQVLVTSGIYRYIRHPIYMGDVFLITGFELALNSWLFVLGFFIAIVVIRQALQEEEMLANAFPEYVEYCLRTKRFLPFVL